jgi:hypothetical protein
MAIIFIPENIRETRHCQFDDDNLLAGTRCPHSPDGDSPPCTLCEYAIHDVQHLSFIGLRLREIPRQIAELAEEKNPWPITQSRSKTRGQIQSLLTEFYLLTELMKSLETYPDIPGVVPSAVGYFERLSE